MKVIIVTDCFSYEGRCERLCRIVNSFIRSGEYELYAFCTYEDKIEADIISFIPVSGRGGIAECIDLAGLVVGEERFFLVLERCADSVNYEKMLKKYRKNPRKSKSFSCILPCWAIFADSKEKISIFAFFFDHEKGLCAEKAYRPG